MAFKEVLTPILGLDADEPKLETTAEFMNMKFDELLENTKDNANKISILSQYRGVFASDANTIATNGWWRVQNGATNVPMPYGLIESKKIYLDADASGNYKYWEQTFTEFTISSSTKYYRTSYNDRVTWSPWQELATTDKIDNLWTGAASSGDITLSASAENYHSLILRLGKSGTYYEQIIECLSLVYPAKIHYAQPITALHYGGAFVLVPKVQVTGNLIYTIQTNPSTLNLVSVKGVLKGSV
jgi:hypothetical protein